MSQPAALIASQRIVQIKPPGLSPMTPTRKGQGAKLHLPDSSPPTAEDYTDWVAYSAPIPELDEINVDSGDNSFESVGSQSTVSRASTPCTMIECALDAETESSSSATECEQELVSQTSVISADTSWSPSVSRLRASDFCWRALSTPQSSPLPPRLLPPWSLFPFPSPPRSRRKRSPQSLPRRHPCSRATHAAASMRA